MSKRFLRSATAERPRASVSPDRRVGGPYASAHAPLGLFLAVALTALALVGCGGSSHPAHGFRTAVGVQAHSPTFGLPPKGVAPPQRSVTATAEMYDSVTISTIPAAARAVAGYLLPSSWPTYGNGSLARAFPHAVRVPIAVQSYVIIRGVTLGCLDVEPGDAVPSQAPGWVRAELAAHVKPCVYSNLSEWAQVRSYLASAGITRSSYYAWLAYWTYHPGLVGGYDLVQWTNHALGRNLDENTVSLAVLGATPRPRTVCFGKNAQGSAACRRIHAEVAGWARGRDASARAFAARGCPKLDQRDTWFAQMLKRHPRTKTAYRRGALAASRRAYRQRDCATFLGRQESLGRLVEETTRRYS